MRNGIAHWRGRLATTLGVIALLTHVVLAAAHVPPSLAAPAAPGELCHTEPGDTPPPAHPPGHDHPLPPCPICQTLQLDGIWLTPAAPVLGPAAHTVARLGPAAEPPAAGTLRAAPFQARAPPFLA